jgi:hypothetical protein
VIVGRERSAGCRNRAALSTDHWKKITNAMVLENFDYLMTVIVLIIPSLVCSLPSWLAMKHART